MAITLTPNAITLRCTVVVNAVQTLCNVCETPDEDAVHPVSRAQDVVALWDTGATNSCISNRVAALLNLEIVGTTTIRIANGTAVVPIHLVDIELPNGLYFRRLQVYECDLEPEDVIIGMDVMSQGDFAICTGGNKTTFSFRKPAGKVIDFVKNFLSRKKTPMR
jgi:hypothetical protein